MLIAMVSYKMGKRNVERAIELLERHFYSDVAEYVKNNHPEMEKE